MTKKRMSDKETPLSGWTFEEVCDAMVGDGGLELSNLAYQSLYIEGMSNDSFVMVLAQWTPRWRAFMEEFLPDEDFGVDDSPKKSIYISGRFTFSICERLCEHFPDYADAFTRVPPIGQVKFVALAGEGFVLYDVTPSSTHLQ